MRLTPFGTATAKHTVASATKTEPCMLTVSRRPIAASPSTRYPTGNDSRVVSYPEREREGDGDLDAERWEPPRSGRSNQRGSDIGRLPPTEAPVMHADLQRRAVRAIHQAHASPDVGRDRSEDQCGDRCRGDADAETAHATSTVLRTPRCASIVIASRNPRLRYRRERGFVVRN